MLDWLTFIVVLFIFGVLLDGLRRVRAHRRETLRMSRSVRKSDALEDDGNDLTSSEFPGGGPRVVGVRDTSDVVNINQNLREIYVASKQTCGSPRRKGENESLKLNTPVPMLMDSVEDNGNEREADYDEVEPALGSLDNLDDEDDHSQEREDEVLSAPEDFEHDDLLESDPYQPLGKKDEAVQESPIISEPITPTQERASQNEQEKPSVEANTAPDEVLVIHVMARRGELFGGADLLESMLSQGLRFGDMDIFHRHESSDGRGKILFSVANMVVPGTFDLEAMDDFESPGISMFLSLPIASDSLAAYNLMAESAQNIAQYLGGELKDENRSVMTRQTIEHDRQRVIEYERKRRLAKS